jgi:hypothetical protein
MAKSALYLYFNLPLHYSFNTSLFATIIIIIIIIIIIKYNVNI